MTGHPLPPHVQAFFTERLISQLGASPNTVAGYRDAFRPLLNFAEGDAGKRPTDLLVEDVDAGLVGRFLDHLEGDRRNGARTRNVRLTAIRSFFTHVSRREPALLDHCRQVPAIPSKRFERRTLEWLDGKEIKALLAQTLQIRHRVRMPVKPLAPVTCHGSRSRSLPVKARRRPVPPAPARHNTKITDRNRRVKKIELHPVVSH